MTVIGASLLMGLAVWIAMPSATRKQEGRHLPAWSGIPVGFVVAWLLFGASGVVWAVMTVVVGETVLVVVRRQRRRAQILKGGREVAGDKGFGWTGVGGRDPLSCARARG